MTLINESQDFCSETVVIQVTFTPNTSGDHTIDIDGGTPVIHDVALIDVGTPVTVNANYISVNGYCDSTTITGNVFANCDPETEVPFSVIIPVQTEDCRNGAIVGEGMYPIRTVDIINGGAGYNNGGSTTYTNVPVIAYDISNALHGTGFLLNLVIQSGVIVTATVAAIGDGYAPVDWATSPITVGFQPDPAVVGTPTTIARIEGNFNSGDAYTLPIDLAGSSCEPGTGQTDLIIEQSYQDFIKFTGCIDTDTLPYDLDFSGKQPINNCCCMECKVGVVIVEDIASGSGTMFFQDYGTRKILTRDFDNQLSDVYIFANNTYYEKFDTTNDIIDQSLYLGNHSANNGSRLIDSNGALCVGNIHYADCDGPEVFNGNIVECSNTGVSASYDLASMGGDIAPFDPSPTFEFYDDYTLTTPISNTSSYQNSVNRKLIIVVTTGANGKKSISRLSLQYQTPCPPAES